MGPLSASSNSTAPAFDLYQTLNQMEPKVSAEVLSEKFQEALLKNAKDATDLLQECLEFYIENHKTLLSAEQIVKFEDLAGKNLVTILSNHPSLWKLCLEYVAVKRLPLTPELHKELMQFAHDHKFMSLLLLLDPSQKCSVRLKKHLLKVHCKEAVPEFITLSDSRFTVPVALRLSQLNQILPVIEKMQKRAKEDSEIKRLNFKGVNLGVGHGDAFKKILHALESNKHITHLKFSNCALGNSNMDAVADLIQKNEVITHLNLDQNGISTDGIEKFAKSLATNKTLTDLSLKVNKVDAKGAKVIADALGENTSLTFIKLGRNQIRNDGAIALAKALSNNQCIKKIKMEDNQIYSFGASKVKEIDTQNRVKMVDETSKRRIFQGRRPRQL